MIVFMSFRYTKAEKCAPEKNLEDTWILALYVRAKDDAEKDGFNVM